MKKSICFFTLVELLTVIAVIAILAGIAVPVIVGMSSKGKETTARADMNSIKLALTQFKADYSVWPVPTSSGDLLLQAAFVKNEDGNKDSDIDTMMSELTTFVGKVTSATDHTPVKKTSYSYNVKKRQYLDPPAKAAVPLEAITDGVVDKSKMGFYKLDPWGRRYNIAVDTDYNKKLVLPPSFLRLENSKPDEIIAGDIAIFSFGSAESATAGDADLDAFLYSWKTLEK